MYIFDNLLFNTYIFIYFLKLIQFRFIFTLLYVIVLMIQTKCTIYVEIMTITYTEQRDLIDTLKCGLINSINILSLTSIAYSIIYYYTVTLSF